MASTLISFQAAKGSAVEAGDGSAGTFADLMFDRGPGTVRYLTLQAASELLSRHVLVSPQVVERTNWPQGPVVVRLNQQQIQSCPRVDEHRSVSRQQELELAGHFGWQPYWQTGIVGVPDTPGLPEPVVTERIQRQDEPDLWSAKDLLDLDVESLDGNIGRAEDLVFDDQRWEVRSLVVELRMPQPGRRVLIPLPRIQAADWKSREMRVDLTKREVLDSPDFDPRQGRGTVDEARR